MPDLQTITREDLALFVNACFVGTGQREFYSDQNEQVLSLGFLHEYICGNYRRLYARCLAVGVNHLNRLEIVRHLLMSGKSCPAAFRLEEGRLIRGALRRLPPQRVWKLFERLRHDGVNNRRTRATIREYIRGHKDMNFQAIKYRHKVRSSVLHAHLHLDGELPEFLFTRKPRYATPLFEAYRAAQYSAEAIYNLPFSVAEGFAVKHKVSRDVFLKRIQPKLTERERLRLQASTEGRVKLEPEKLALSEFCAYLLSLSLQERKERRDELQTWLETATNTASGLLERLPLQGRVAAVLDNSFSSSGSDQKRNRPLVLAWAVHRLLGATMGANYRAFWTTAMHDELMLHAKGQTNLGERLLDALEWGAQTVIVVSDGVENAPSGAFRALLKGYWKIGGRATVLHFNPVFDPSTLEVARLHPRLPALGLRSSDDLPALLGFARFLSNEAKLEDLEAYLETRAQRLLATIPDEDVPE
jgi:hypothetical protein